MTDFAEFLDWSIQGSEVFLRTVDSMTDEDFSGESSLPEWSRSKVVAHVAYNARAIGNLVHWAITGIETPMYRSAGERAEQLGQGLRMSIPDLRDFVNQADGTLTNHFRTLDNSSINNIVTTAQGRRVHASELPWMRAKETWVHAVDLDHGVSFRDFPEKFVDELLTNIVTQRQQRTDHPRLVLIPNDRDRSWMIGDQVDDIITVRGGASELASWLAGRRYEGLESESGSLPEIGPWF